MAKRERSKRSHEAILESAARLLRESGIAGASVADVMKGAGLTVGGFYAHFASKAELVDEALRRTGAAVRERLFARLDERPAAERVDTIVKRYLSPEHRDLDDDACPLPSVVSEIATTEHHHARVLRGEIDAMASGLEPELRGSGPLPRRRLALALVALMYGGLSLARALRG